MRECEESFHCCSVCVLKLALAACKVAGYLFGYGNFTGESITRQEEGREPLIGRGTETA